MAGNTVNCDVLSGMRGVSGRNAEVKPDDRLKAEKKEAKEPGKEKKAGSCKENMEENMEVEEKAEESGKVKLSKHGEKPPAPAVETAAEGVHGKEKRGLKDATKTGETVRAAQTRGVDGERETKEEEEARRTAGEGTSGKQPQADGRNTEESRGGKSASGESGFNEENKEGKRETDGGIHEGDDKDYTKQKKKGGKGKTREEEEGF